MRGEAHGNSKDKVKEIMSAFDADRNNYLSKAEFVAAVQKEALFKLFN